MLKLLIIGLGRQGYKHFLAAKKLEKDNLLQIVGICDIKKNDKINKPFYSDYEKAIRDLQPGAVIISTTNDTHLEISSFCIKNGIHVLKEKPMNLNIKDACKLLKLAKENNVFITFSMTESDNGKIYNSQILINNSCNIIAICLTSYI